MVVARANAPHRIHAATEDRHNRAEAPLEVLYPSVVQEAPPLAATFETAYQLAQKFISNIRRRTVNRDLLDLMTRDSNAFIDEYRQMAASKQQEERALEASMQSIVDRSFASVEPYVEELNSKLGRSELHVACTFPEWVAEEVGSGPNRERRSYYRARISTGRLAIVIRGSKGQVDFYILPVSFVMGLSKVEDLYFPLMSFAATQRGAFMDWEVEGKALTRERLERYCILLFNFLLEETKTDLRASVG